MRSKIALAIQLAFALPEAELKRFHFPLVLCSEKSSSAASDARRLHVLACRLCTQLNAMSLHPGRVRVYMNMRTCTCTCTTALLSAVVAYVHTCTCTCTCTCYMYMYMYNGWSPGRKQGCGSHPHLAPAHVQRRFCPPWSHMYTLCALAPGFPTHEKPTSLSPHGMVHAPTGMVLPPGRCVRFTSMNSETFLLCVQPRSSPRRYHPAA